MKRSTGRFLTTHTGSLPRPEDLVRMMYAREEGVPVERALEISDRAYIMDHGVIVHYDTATKLLTDKAIQGKVLNLPGTDTSTYVQSTRKPRAVTTFAHFAISLCICLPSFSGLLLCGTIPVASNRDFTSGSVRTLAVSAFRRAMISAGVPVGTTIPYQALVS